MFPTEIDVRDSTFNLSNPDNNTDDYETELRNRVKSARDSNKGAERVLSFIGKLLIALL